MPKSVVFRSVYNPDNVVEFFNEFDITEMRKHPEYVEVKEEERKEKKETPQAESKPEAVTETTPVKRGRGRPKKVTTEAV